MSLKIDEYLGRVARELRHLPAPVRENELREMRSHLEQMIEDGKGAGQNPGAATQTALMRFGEARAVGIKMRDVWDGEDFGWKRVVAAFIFGLAPFLGYWAVMKGWDLFQTWPESVFFANSNSIPLLFDFGAWGIDCSFALFLLLPVMTAVIHAFFLGRRAWMMGAVIYGYRLCWSALTVFIYPPGLWGGVSLLFRFTSLTAVPAWCLFWGVLVADVTARWLRWRRHRQLVLVGSDSFPGFTSRQRVKSPRSHWRLVLASLAIGVTIWSGFRVSSAMQKRLNIAHHPQNAPEAVRIKLLLARDAGKVQPYGEVTVAERPPSAAERAAGTRVVYFKSSYQLNQQYQQLYLSYLNSQLATESGCKRWGKKKLQHSLSEVYRNNFRFSGTAIVRKTSHGWQIDEKQRPWMHFGPDLTFDWTRLQTWLRDIPFEN